MKTSLKTFFALVAVTGLAACNQSPLLPEGSLSEGSGTLSLSVVHHLEDGSALAADGSSAKTLTNDLGYQVILAHGEVHFHLLTLVSSGDDPECTGGHDTTITLSGADDLLGEDLVETGLGDHMIPLASFCSYKLAMGLHLTGTWSKDGGAETAFEFEPEETVTAAGVFGHPLHFHEGETETAKVFSLAYDVLFDGVDFENDDADSLLQKIESNLTVEIDGIH